MQRASAKSTHLVFHGDQEAGVLVGAVVHISAVVAAPELDLFDVEAGRTQVNLPPIAVVLVAGDESVAFTLAGVL